MTIGQHIIRTDNLQTAARRVCAWVDGQRPAVDLTAVSQVHVEGYFYTPIFWRNAVCSAAVDDKSTYKVRPLTGARRLTRQPLKMDKLPSYVQDAVIYLRKQSRTWSEIEPIIHLFPRRRLPHSNMHRWYDLRVEQPASFEG